MYDSYTGRFMEEDPLGFDAGDMNLYRYVKNDPTNATDPSGLFGVPNVELLLRPLTTNGEPNQQMLGNPAEMCLPLEAMVTEFSPCPSVTARNSGRPLQQALEELQRVFQNFFDPPPVEELRRMEEPQELPRMEEVEEVQEPPQERIQPMCIVPLRRLGDTPNWRNDIRGRIWLFFGATDDTLVPSMLPTLGGGTAPAMAGAMRMQGLARLRALGLGNVQLAGSGFNAGRRALEAAGFRMVETTPTGRVIFRHSRTGAEVHYDSRGGPHWHIRDQAGQRLDRTGRIVDSDDEAGHIPAR